MNPVNVLLRYLFVLFLLTSQVVNAEGLFQIINRQYGANPQSVIDAAFDNLEAQVNASLPNSDNSTFLSGLANSTVMAGAGLGVDYATPFDLFLVGGKAGLAGALGQSSATDVNSLNSVAAFSGQVALLVGLRGSVFGKKRGRLGPFHLDRLRFFLSWFQETLSVDVVQLGFQSLGLHMQYKLVPSIPKSYSFFGWGGIDATVGVRRSNVSFLVSQPVDVSYTDPGPPNVDMRFQGTAEIGADVTTYSVPIELSTSVRVLYLFSLFTGFNADFSFGSAASLSGAALPVTVTNPVGVSADAIVDLGEASSPNVINSAWFAGVQLELYKVNLSLQFTTSFTTDAFGLVGGLNTYF